MQVNKVQREIDNTRRTLAAIGPLLKGSVNKVILGKKKSAPGNRIAYLLTYKGEGNRTTSVYVKKDQVTEVRAMLRNYQQIKKILNKLVELNVTLFKTRQAIKRRVP